MRFSIHFLLLVTGLLLGCSPSNDKILASEQKKPGTGFPQRIALTVDGQKLALSDSDLITASYASGKTLNLTGMSEGKNVQLSISVHLPMLEPGSYEVSYCNGPVQCDSDVHAQGENASYGPYPKGDIPKPGTYKFSYDVPKLGLKPLVLVITSVEDAQRAGVPFKTKRIKGEFKGTLAGLLQDENNKWSIAGRTQTLAGSFDLYCTVM